jgi:hypothetical protein
VLVYIYRGDVYFLDGGLVIFVLVTKVCEIHTFFSVHRSSEKKSKEKESAVSDQWRCCEIMEESSVYPSSEGIETASERQKFLNN